MIEGIDGAGKTTQARASSAGSGGEGLPAVISGSRRRGRWGREIKRMAQRRAP